MSSSISEPTDTPTLTPPPAKSLWRLRDFQILLWGQVISGTGSQASLIAFPLLTLAMTHSLVQAGLVGAVRALPYTLISLPVGALVDRWNRKRLMLWCDTGRALALGSIPLAYAFGVLSMPQVLLVALIEGTLFVFFDLAGTASLPRIVAHAQIPNAVAAMNTTDATSQLLGPILSGALFAVSRVLPFLADAVSYAVSVCSLFFIRTPFQEDRAVARRPMWAEIGEGIRWLWGQPVLRFLAVLTWALASFGAGFPLILIALSQRLHASAAVIGLLFGTSGIGTLIGSASVAPLRRRFGTGPLLIASSWIWALSWLLYPFAPNVYILGLANLIGYIVVPIYMTTQFSYRLQHTPDVLQGRVNSVYRLIAFGSQPIGVALAGVLLTWLGPLATIGIIMIPELLLAAIATGMPVLRRAP